MEDPNKIEELTNKYVTRKLTQGLHIVYGLLGIQILIVFPNILLVLTFLALILLYANEQFKIDLVWEYAQWLDRKMCESKDFQAGCAYAMMHNNPLADDPFLNPDTTFYNFLNEKYHGHTDTIEGIHSEIRIR